MPPGVYEVMEVANRSMLLKFSCKWGCHVLWMIHHCFEVAPKLSVTKVASDECVFLQGGPDRECSYTGRTLTQNDDGLTPLYQSAMCLMQEVRGFVNIKKYNNPKQ